LVNVDSSSVLPTAALWAVGQAGVNGLTLSKSYGQEYSRPSWQDEGEIFPELQRQDL
jgi:hypothetical protein